LPQTRGYFQLMRTILNEGHLRRLIRDYISYYQEDRTHDSLEKDSPGTRPVSCKPNKAAIFNSGLFPRVFHSALCTWFGFVSQYSIQINFEQFRRDSWSYQLAVQLLLQHKSLDKRIKPNYYDWQRDRRSSIGFLI
jgi:hypothetical protein